MFVVKWNLSQLINIKSDINLKLCDFATVKYFCLLKIKDSKVKWIMTKMTKALFDIRKIYSKEVLILHLLFIYQDQLKKRNIFLPKNHIG